MNIIENKNSHLYKSVISILEKRGIEEDDITEICTKEKTADHSYYSEIGPGSKIHSTVDIPLVGTYKIYYKDKEILDEQKKLETWMESNKGKWFWNKSKRPETRRYKETTVYLDEIIELMLNRLLIG